WRPGTWGWRGTARASRLRALNWELAGVEAALKGDRSGISVDIDRASYASGAVTGWVQVGLGEEVRRTRPELHLADVDAEKLRADSRIPVGDLASRLTGTLAYHFREADWRHGDGSGEFRASGDPRQGHGLQLAGTLPLVVANGVVTAPALHLTAPAQAVD